MSSGCPSPIPIIAAMYRCSSYLLPTTREDPAGAEIPSHRLLIRGGFVRQLMAGVYSHLPLMWRAIRKAMQIVREEQDRIGAQELFLPALNPAELWQESGRWTTFGDEMFRLKDRKGSDACLAPTHEEVIADLARAFIQSYRDMPQQWYQIQTKFRDEPRPRSGVLRGRQFIMKDAYSLDVDAAGLDAAYALQREAYQRTFRRCGIEFVIVGASSGLMGGSGSEEFMVLTPSGEDTIAVCPGTGYASNVEVAQGVLPPERRTPPLPEGSELPPLEEAATPDKKTIEEVAEYLGVAPQQTLKTLLFMTTNDTPFPVMAVVRGDHNVNEVVLSRLMGHGLRPAHLEEIEPVTGGPAGFISPVGQKDSLTIIVDADVEPNALYVAGANRPDLHLRNVYPPRDFPPHRHERIRLVQEGDLEVSSGQPLLISRAIELGHIFKLGTRYGESLGARYLDEHGQQHPIWMGSYGIGLERIVACAIEQHHDDKGCVFPLPIAPFHAMVLVLDPAEPSVRDAGESLGTALESAGWEVLLDDREERPGVKFADADLSGIPFQVIVGRKGLAAGELEIKRRRDGERTLVPLAEAAARLQALLAEEQARYQPL